MTCDITDAHWAWTGILGSSDWGADSLRVCGVTFVVRSPTVVVASMCNEQGVVCLNLTPNFTENIMIIVIIKTIIYMAYGLSLAMTYWGMLIRDFKI